jgi:hypothetical protein
MCIAWHPIWQKIARTAKVRRQAVQSILFVLQNAPDLPLARDDDMIASAANVKEASAIRVLLLMRGLGIIDRENRLSPEWSLVTVSDDETSRASPASQRRRPRTGAERTAKWRAKQKAAETTANPPPAAYSAAENDVTSPVVTASQPSLSLSLFPDEQIEDQGKIEKTPRAPDQFWDEFEALRAIWPKQEAIEDARKAYRWARKTKSATAQRIAAGAERYIANKPDWQEPVQLWRWLRSERWKDGERPEHLPLPPRLVESAPEPELDEVSQRLRDRIGAVDFNRWFRAARIEQGEVGIRVFVRSAFVRNHIGQHFEMAMRLAWQTDQIEIVTSSGPLRRTG